MPESVRQICKICQKVFDVPYEKAWARRARHQRTHQVCSRDCRDISRFMTDGSDKNRPVLDVKHGTNYAYRQGCRCGDCSEKNKVEIKKYRENIRAKIEAGKYELDGTYNCNHCGKEFKRALSVARGSFKYSKTGKFYCSLRCSAMAREKAKREAK